MYNFYFCRIHRAALWILGEYCETNEDIQNVMTMIRQALGEVRKGSRVQNCMILVTYRSI